MRPEGCGLGGWPHRAVGQQGACWVVGGLGVWPSSLLCSLQSSFAGAPAPSLQEGSDSGLSESEESVFSGLEDSGSDSSEDDPAEEEEEVSSDEGHSGQKTAGQQAATPSPSTEVARVQDCEEYAVDSSDEEDIRNTVGNVPLEWYDDFPHVGYDLDGRRIYKPLRTRDELDQFLDKMDNPDYW